MTEPTTHELIGRLFSQIVEYSDIVFTTVTPDETSISVHGLDPNLWPLHNENDSAADSAIREAIGPDDSTHWLYVARPTTLDALQAAASLLAFPTGETPAADHDLLDALRRSLR